MYWSYNSWAESWMAKPPIGTLAITRVRGILPRFLPYFWQEARRIHCGCLPNSFAIFGNQAEAVRCIFGYNIYLRENSHWFSTYQIGVLGFEDFAHGFPSPQCPGTSTRAAGFEPKMNMWTYRVNMCTSVSGALSAIRTSKSAVACSVRPLLGVPTKFRSKRYERFKKS